ncbi:MAG: hypothetical protein QF704_12945, partial [Anaerolineales bacterium]|nr:hypothetical protein [Anaerolineales bacterium]
SEGEWSAVALLAEHGDTGEPGADQLFHSSSSSNVTIPVDNDGNVLTGGYGGSGNSFALFSGSYEYIPVDSDNPMDLNAGDFLVFVYGSDGIVSGGRAIDGNTIIFSDASGMTANAAWIDWGVVCKRADTNQIQAFTLRQTFSKVYAGGDGIGEDGVRGSQHFYGQSSAAQWSDALAVAIVVAGSTDGVLRNRDTVHLYKEGDWATTKYYDQSGAWIEVAQVINGTLIVQGTIGAHAIDTDMVWTQALNVGSGTFQVDGSGNCTAKSLTLTGHTTLLDITGSGTYSLDNFCIGDSGDRPLGTLADNAFDKHNIAIGNGVMSSMQHGQQNIGIGYHAMASVVSEAIPQIHGNAFSNIAIGFKSFGGEDNNGDIQEPKDNVVIGTQAMSNAEGGYEALSYNIAIGTCALQHLGIQDTGDTINHNTAVGFHAGQQLVEGHS